MRNVGSLLIVRLQLTYKKLRGQQTIDERAGMPWQCISHRDILAWALGGAGVSGVASGQVETTKYVEFRNVATSSFAGHLTCFCNHGDTMFL